MSTREARVAETNNNGEMVKQCPTKLLNLFHH